MILIKKLLYQWKRKKSFGFHFIKLYTMYLWYDRIFIIPWKKKKLV